LNSYRLKSCGNRRSGTVPGGKESEDDTNGYHMTSLSSTA
jgi:hypothetical protein